MNTAAINLLKLNSAGAESINPKMKIVRDSDGKGKILLKAKLRVRFNNYSNFSKIADPFFKVKQWFIMCQIFSDWYFTRRL